MSWGGVGEFLHMGGYATYVWGSYAVTIGLIALEALLLGRRERATLRRLRRELARGAAR